MKGEELSRQLGSRLATAVVMFHGAVADRLGVNLTDYRCMEILWRTGPANPGRLAELAGMSTAAMAQVLGRLERSGMIVRQPDLDDRRRTVVRLVEGGPAQEVLAEVFGGFVRRVSEVGEHYDDEQLGAISAYLGEVSDVLEGEARRLRRG